MSTLRRHLLTLFGPMWLLLLSAILLPPVVFGTPSAEFTTVPTSCRYDECEPARFGYDNGAELTGFSYVAASVFTSGQARNDTTGDRTLFVKFSEFLAAESTAARTFTASAPLVADLANKIEAAYPGHVVGVEVPVRNAAGQLVTDLDIMLKNAVIQVKSGGGKGLTSQILRTEQATGLPTIGYGPTLKPSVVNGIQKAGKRVNP